MIDVDVQSAKPLTFFVIFYETTGIPVWIGRKLHTRYRLSGKHKRNFAVLGGVAASVSESFFYTLFSKANKAIRVKWLSIIFVRLVSKHLGVQRKANEK